jgi:hypothetical protein
MISFLLAMLFKRIQRLGSPLLGLSCILLTAQSMASMTSLTQPSLRDFEENAGRTFSTPGPNCFGTALRMLGFNSSFRGVGIKEFTALTQLACHPVAKPQFGDIGVFETPRFGFVHAYIYISADQGFDKPGVDSLVGTSSVDFRHLYHITYAHLMSPECRQYAPDTSVCSNLHYYLHCDALNLNSSVELQKHNQKILETEAQIENLLQKKKYSAVEVLALEKSIRELEQQLTAITKETPEVSFYLQSRLLSLNDQLKFFKLKLGI